MYKTLHKKQGSVTVQLRFARSSVTFCAKRDNRGHDGSRGRVLFRRLHRTYLRQDAAGGMRNRHKTCGNGDLHDREHLPEIHAGRIRSYEVIDMEPIIIGIAGGSGSGKSTFTNRLRQYFGDDVVVIYHDNYYRRQDGIPFEQRVKVNYDHPDSLETDLLVEHLKELKAGKTIECPVYDYSQHNRSSEIIRIEPRPIILVEGILLLADERIRNLLDIKVYVEADADERILRRIVRDVEERGRDLKGIITQYLTTVKPMHYMYVEPTRALADIVINSGKNDVAFDLFVSKIGQLLESAGE